MLGVMLCVLVAVAVKVVPPTLQPPQGVPSLIMFDGVSLRAIQLAHTAALQPWH